MKPISFLLTFVAVAALAIAGMTTAAALRSRHALSCNKQEGDIVAYVPAVGHSCPGTLTLGLTVYRTETLHSSNNGQLIFETRHLHRCIEFSARKGSADIIYPRPGIAIRHLRGKTWCQHLASDLSNTLTAAGAIFRADGTILGIDSRRHGSIIKVSDGQVVATSTVSGQTITIQAGFQAFIPRAGPLKKPQPAHLDAKDRQGAFLLSSNILSIGPKQPAQYLTEHKQTSVVIVGQEFATAKAEATRLPGTRLQVLTADQVFANPRIVILSARKLAARTVIAVGTFNVMQPILKLIASEIPPQFALLTVLTG